MAILEVHGFDTSTSGIGWVYSSNGLNVVPGRFGNGLQMRMYQTGTSSRIFSSSFSSGGVCFAFNPNRVNVAGAWLALREGATIHVDLRITAAGLLSVTRNGTVLATSSYTCTASVWIHMEMYVEIHDSAGVVKVWVNGNPTPVINLSGVDTRNGGTGIVDGMLFYGNANNGNYSYVDDVVVYDTSGSYNNAAPLGDLRVTAIAPSAAGTTTSWTPNAGDNYAAVDDSTPDSDTTYVETDTVGNIDTYNYGALGVSGTVLAVQSRMYALKTDAGTRQIAARYVSAGGSMDGATKDLGASYEYLLDLKERQADGSAWTISDIDNAEFGVKVIT